MLRHIGKFLFLVLIFFSVAGISTYFTLTFLIKHEKRVVVPDLLGKNAVNALLLLSDLSLYTKVTGTEYSDNVPIHHIIYQEPPPGTEIKKNRSVRIVISKGSKTVVVPNLKGLRLLQAQIILEENGLVIAHIARTYHDTIDTDVIIAQSISEGTVLVRSEPVSILVSQGKRPLSVLMPDFIGRSIEETILLIDKLGLSLGETNTVFNGDFPLDRIIRQTPPKGHRIMQGDRISVTMNRVTGRGTSISTKPAKLVLFRQKIKPGFLKQHVRIRLNAYGISVNLLNDFLLPGDESWCLVPTQSGTSLFVYLDDELIKTKIFE